MGAVEHPLTIRHFSWGSEVNVPRLWPFQDLLHKRSDIDYYVHLVGRYAFDETEVAHRDWVTCDFRLPRLRRPEVWVIRGWYHPELVLYATTASLRKIPILMWSEPPGATYEATRLGQSSRIWLREHLLPFLFLPYRRRTILLGTGRYAIQRFAELTNGRRADNFPYPDPIADALAARPPSAFPRNEPSSLLFVGRFERRKGVDLLAEANERLWRAGLEFRIRYVGFGPMEPLLHKHVERSGGRAQIVPFARGDALLEQFATSHGLVLPSRWDGWGMVVHEALAAGLPVVTSDACGSSWHVSSTRCGRVFPVGDLIALQDALSWCVSLDTDQRQEIRLRGRETVAHWTMQELGDRMVELSRQALALRE